MFHKITQLIRMGFKLKLHFRVLGKVLKLNENIMENKNNLFWNENDYLSKLTIISIVKNIHRLKSILILCKCGQAKLF
jgi:hypothetical protein